MWQRWHYKQVGKEWSVHWNGVHTMDFSVVCVCVCVMRSLLIAYTFRWVTTWFCQTLKLVNVNLKRPGFLEQGRDHAFNKLNKSLQIIKQTIQLENNS